MSATNRAVTDGLTDEGGFVARWVGDSGKRHRRAFDDERAAVHHVARDCAGGLRFRDLRHSYATWLVDDGVPPNMVQWVMGHERSATTLDLRTRRTDDPTRILRALDDEDPDDPDDGPVGALVPAWCPSAASLAAETTNGLAGSSRWSL